MTTITLDPDLYKLKLSRLILHRFYSKNDIIMPCKFTAKEIVENCIPEDLKRKINIKWEEFEHKEDKTIMGVDVKIIKKEWMLHFIDNYIRVDSDGNLTIKGSLFIPILENLILNNEIFFIKENNKDGEAV